MAGPPCLPLCLNEFDEEGELGYMLGTERLEMKCKLGLEEAMRFFFGRYGCKEGLEVLVPYGSDRILLLLLVAWKASMVGDCGAIHCDTLRCMNSITFV